MKSAAVDDRYASVAIAPAVDELLHARDGLDGRLAVQVEHAAWDVVAALELAKLPPIHTAATYPSSAPIPLVITCW
jgi:hypothetical protein